MPFVDIPNFNPLPIISPIQGINEPDFINILPSSIDNCVKTVMSTKGFISYSIEKYKIILEKQSKIAIEVCTTVNDSPFYILLISNSLVNKEIIGEFNYFTQNTTFTPNDASNHLDSILVLPTKVNELGIWMALWGGIMGCVLVNMWAIFNDGYSDMDSLKNRLMIGFLSGATVGFIWVKTRR